MSFDTSKLTPRELEYFYAMNGQYGVLYVEGKPGIAKSAKFESIATKLGMDFKPFHLSMVDEIDVGLMPDKKMIEGVNYQTYITPLWAKEANDKPTLIFFDELNRATQNVRNAALQILLERRIGMDFKFNENVYFVAAGNLGEEDDTDVEEFDKALWNRLITVRHDLPLDSWVDDFAAENVNPSIVAFVSSHPDYYYKKPTEDTKSYPTPRSWTMLSRCIEKNFGLNAQPNEFLVPLKDLIRGFVGSAAASKFVKFCEEQMNLSFDDLFENYNKLKPVLDQMVSKFKDKPMEYAQEFNRRLKDGSANKMSETQVKNFSLFMKEYLSLESKVSIMKQMFDDTKVDAISPGSKFLNIIRNNPDAGAVITEHAKKSSGK